MRFLFLTKLFSNARKRLSKNGLFTIFRHTWNLLAIFLVILAIVFSLFHSLTPWVKPYREKIQQQLSVWVGRDVVVQDMETSWYWFTPVLKLNQVTIGEAHERPLHFNQVMVGINLFSSLLHWHVQPGVLYVDNAHLKIHQKEDVWQIDGFELPGEADVSSNPTTLLPFIRLLLAQDKVIIKHVSAELSLQDGRQIILQNLYFKADHHGQRYRIHSQASVGGKPNIQIKMVANIELNGYDVTQLSGQVYLSVSRTDLSVTQTIFPRASDFIKEGAGSVDAWLDMVHGHITQVQASVALHDVVVHDPNHISRKISRATANMAWQQTSQGWRLTADHLLLHLDAYDWPENAFILDYRKEGGVYHSYVKTLPLKQLLHSDLPWPTTLQPILALKPKGDLGHTELTWQNGEIRDFLTQFSHLSWAAKNDMPGITELSGAIYWQPTEGYLKLNGEQSILSLPKPLAPIVLDTLNLSLDWKHLNEQLQVNVRQLQVTHPNLIVNATGELNDPTGTAANVNLQLDFSAKDAQIWLPYIPSKGLKPKLDAWLKQDILRIEQATGRIRLVGPLADFPFDNQQGQFSIQAHVNGLDLLTNKDWPVNADIDADLQLTGRNLVADVHQATLAGVVLHQVSISLPNIGLGKEVFLLHGLVLAPGEKIKSYVFSSPLQNRFARWKALTVEGMFGLELNLEVPLYPESEHVYAKGLLDFKQNGVVVELPDNPAEFIDVNGRLDFNEYGLTSGGLSATLNDHPFSMRVEPLLGPQSGTELRIDGEVDIEYLQHVIHHPVFSVMEGRFMVTGLWTVYPDSPEADKLYLNSSLVGMAVHLPKPFGKSAAAIAPLTIRINFSPKNRMDFDVNYAQKLTGIFSMQELLQKKWITTGDFHLGEGRITKNNTSGLRINGSLLDLNLNEWQAVWKKWPQEPNSASLMTSLKDVNLVVSKLTMGQLICPNVTLRAHQNSPQEWALKVDQKNIAGFFTYNWTKNLLSARIAHLNMEAFHSSSSYKSTPKMSAIPNLDVLIDSINYHGIDMGKLRFKSSTSPGHWILDEGKLETPEYDLGFKGDWFEQNKQSDSTIEAQLHLTHLADALDRWHVTPVVEARYGQMTFYGKWPSAFYEGSLRTLSGKMALVLRDGHITHLDSDTEKKLGLGKLLSILSLQTIPRRLKLDFSDLAQKGYSFDIFKGDFLIQNGIMSTQNSYIDGPVAIGRMSGDLDLVNQLYDLDLRIFPYITASLPVVATIVGTPVAGVAVWAVSSLASKGMQKISGYKYKISGPWMKPVVQQTSIDKSVH